MGLRRLMFWEGMVVRRRQDVIQVDVRMDDIWPEITDEELTAEVADRKLALNTTRYTKRDLIEAINSGDRVHCGIVIAAIFGDGE